MHILRKILGQVKAQSNTSIKKWVCLLLILLSSTFAFSQERKSPPASLYFALERAANDTVRMDVYNAIGIFYGESDQDSSIWYRAKAVLLAHQLGLKIDEADILTGMGYIFLSQGNYPKSFQSLLRALKILEDPANEVNPFHLSDGQTPLNSRLSTLGAAYFVQGSLYGATGNVEKQFSGYRQAISIAESVHDTTELANGYLAFGLVYFDLGKLDSALAFEQNAVRFFSTLTNPSDSKYGGAALAVIGKIYLKKKDFDLSHKTLTEAIQVNRETNNLSSLGTSHLAMAEYFDALAKPDSSLAYARQALAVFKNAAQASGMADAYRLISSLFGKRQQPDSAFSYLNRSVALTDSLAMADRKNLLAFQNLGFDEQLRIEELEKQKIQVQTKTRTYGMAAGLAVFLVVGLILYRNNLQKQHANKVLESTLSDLKATQSQLIQSEKMASLGELTAGIAHEIQNPLNFVNNFSEINKELLDELEEERKKAGDARDVQLENELIVDLRQNMEKINHHGKRADVIIKGMLQHSRSGSVVKEPADINQLADEYLRLAYHGLRAKDKAFNATLHTAFDESIGNLNIVPQDIGRAILNLINNAFYAVGEKKKQQGGGFEPEVSVTTKSGKNKVEIIVSDNGNGIPQHLVGKIFQPFFTTKPTGQGTGLGLSLSYDIIKAHGGELKVETKENEGTSFTIVLPA